MNVACVINHCRNSLASNKTEQQRLTWLQHVISLHILSQISSCLWWKELQLKRAHVWLIHSCVFSVFLHVGSAVSALRTKRSLQVFPRKWPTNLNRCQWKSFQKMTFITFITFIIKHEKMNVYRDICPMSRLSQTKFRFCSFHNEKTSNMNYARLKHPDSTITFSINFLNISLIFYWWYLLLAQKCSLQ